MVTKKVIAEKANRLFKLPPPLLPFSETERTRLLLRRDDIIDLATFNWPVVYPEDYLPDAAALMPASRKAVSELKEELAAWLTARWSCPLNGDKEIYIGASITSLIHQISLAILDPGDVAFVPDLAVPLYRRAITVANAEAIGYENSVKSDWHPRFDRLNTRLGRVARLMFVNTPHNPTGVELSEKDLTDLAWLAGRENIMLVIDAAYAGIPQRLPASLMSLTGGKRVGVEVHSFSYLLGLPPMPIGFVVGHRDLIAALKPLTRLMPTQISGYQVELIRQGLRHHPGEGLKRVRSLLSETAAESGKLVKALHLEGTATGTIPYLWARIDKRAASTTMVRQLFKRNRLLMTPGHSFGETGEGYVRICLTAGPEAVTQAVKRLARRQILKRKEPS